jgi:hypothetical protein
MPELDATPITAKSFGTLPKSGHKGGTMNPSGELRLDAAPDIITREESEAHADQLMADPDFKEWLRQGMAEFGIIEVSIDVGWDFTLELGELFAIARF